MSSYIVVIDDPKDLLGDGSNTPEGRRNAALVLLGDIEGAEGNDCEVAVSVLHANATRYADYALIDRMYATLHDMIDEGGHGSDCILRCIDKGCERAHDGCDKCGMDEDLED